MKKYTRNSFIFLVVLSISVKSIYAQDPVFSQPYANPLYLNPALAGTGNNQRVGLNYQFPNWEGDINTYNASYDRDFIDSNNGIGFLANIEISGYNQDLTTTNISLIYAHQFHIKSFTLSAGVQATYLNLSLDESKIINNGPYMGWGFGGGPILLRNSITVPDFSAGILGYGKNYFFGLSEDHLSQPDESFYEGASLLQMKYTANAGLMIPIGKVILSPTVLYIYQKGFLESGMEFYVNIWHIKAGIGGFIQSSGSEDVSPSGTAMLGYQGKLLRVAYSYNFALPNSSTPTFNEMNEFSLAALLPYSKTKRKKVNGLNCPAF